MKNDKKAKRGKEGIKERVNSSEGQVENRHFSTSYLIQSDSFWPFSVEAWAGLGGNTFSGGYARVRQVAPLN